MTVASQNLPISPNDKHSKVQTALDDLCLEAIVEFADMAASYARSASEAAWRGDRDFLRVHLAQLRFSAIEAIKVFKDLSGETREAA
jgi:hypothetical protein